MNSIDWKYFLRITRALLTLSILTSAIPVAGQSTLAWAKSFGGIQLERPTAICADPAGNSYVAGHYLESTIICGDTLPMVVQTTSSNWTMNLFISKFDNQGNCLWVKPGISLVPAMGGGAREPAIHELEYHDGRLYGVGTFMDRLVIDSLTLSNPSCISFCETRFVLSLDANSGSPVWGKPFLGTSSTSTAPLSLECYDSGLFVAGNYDTQLQVDTVILSPTSFGTNGCLLKFNYAGICEWGRNIGTGTSSAVESMAYDGSRNLYLAGKYSGTIVFGLDSLDDPLPGWAWASYLAKYDTTGNLTWVKGGSADIFGILTHGELAYANDGFLYYTGLFTDSVRFDNITIYSDSGHYNDALVKVDSTGQFIWARKAGHRASNSVFPSSISSNSNGFVLFSGFTDSVSVGNVVVQSNGNLDFLLTQYDQNGNVLFYKNFGSHSQDHPKDVFCQDSSIYFIGGSVGGFSIDTEFILSIGGSDAFIGLIGNPEPPLPVESGRGQESVNLFPNPSTGWVKIRSAVNIDQVVIRNVAGKTLLEASPNSLEYEISLQGTGIYFVITISGGYRETKKLSIAR